MNISLPSKFTLDIPTATAKLKDDQTLINLNEWPLIYPNFDLSERPRWPGVSNNGVLFHRSLPTLETVHGD